LIPNWEHQEVVALVQAKWEEHLASLDVIDLRDYSESVVLKWEKEFTTTMDFGYNAHI